MSCWIKCNERLPVERQRVMVFNRLDGVLDFTCCYHLGEWWTSDDDNYPVDFFTHWMPLPNPPAKD